MSQATFWVDSMNIIYWIHGQSRNYKPFVSHRVGEIHEQSVPSSSTAQLEIGHTSSSEELGQTVFQEL